MRSVIWVGADLWGRRVQWLEHQRSSFGCSWVMSLSTVGLDILHAGLEVGGHLPAHPELPSEVTIQTRRRGLPAGGGSAEGQGSAGTRRCWGDSRILEASLLSL